MILSITSKKLGFEMSLEMCHLLFIHVGVDLRKKLLENAFIHVTAVVLNV